MFSGEQTTGELTTALGLFLGGRSAALGRRKEGSERGREGGREGNMCLRCGAKPTVR